MPSKTTVFRRQAVSPDRGKARSPCLRSKAGTATSLVQAKLRLGPVKDHFETEEEGALLRTRAVPGQGPRVTPRTEARIGALGNGRPLERQIQGFMEARLGCDLSRVRVHTDASAAAAAQAVQARAFTLGHDVVFDRGQYAPGSASGRWLLAHELTHVIQQGQAGPGSGKTGEHPVPTAGRSSLNPPGVARREVSPVVRCYGYYGYAGYGYYPYLYGGGSGGHPCPSAPATPSPDFCRPFPSRADALADRDGSPWYAPGSTSKGVMVLAGATAAAQGSGVAASLYAKFIYGGSSSVENAGAGAADFTSHATTDFVTRKILTDALDGLTHGREAVFSGFAANPQAHVDLPVTSAQRAGVDDQTSDYALNFCGLNLPGIIAGGVGKTQTGPGNLGANTSAARNDFRDVNGSMRVTSQSTGPAGMQLTITPNLEYHVTDTVDFCPGNPGGYFAEFLTVPLSRWEASGISGDVTFELDFPAPSLTAHLTLDRVNGVVQARDPSIS